MLKSMTGFGRHEVVDEKRKIVVEIKSVNHRYSDVTVKLPKKLSFFETSIRNLIKEYVSRGKVDVYVSYEDYTQNNVCVKYNEDIALEYWKHLSSLSEKLQMENDVTISGLSRYPDVFFLEEQSVDEEELWCALKEVVSVAIKAFIDSRISEGKQLEADILSKSKYLLELVSCIEERAPQLLEEYRKKLTGKIQELLGEKQMDESVLATELVIFADKVCVDEETVRLRSHIVHLQKTIEEGKNIGRKLDFIAQEMNREANTILSKANDIQVSNYAIDLKTEIEKIREQIQNIE